MNGDILQAMGEQKSTKINLLQDLLEEGLLAPTGWLEAQGYSRALISRYVDSGWLVSPARGVYRRPGPSLKWQHVVASLQRVAGSYLHVGGRTALVQRGLGHYVRMSGPETIFLYGPEVLPAWVNKLGLQERFVVRNDAMFGSLRARRNASGALVDFHDAPLQPKQLADLGLQEMTWGAWDWRLLYSTDERAMFEVLQDVPARESVYEADVLMQGLVNVRPARVMSLLMACASVKVKRLFLALAERHQHQWLAHLDLTKVDLGKGKRMLAPGGKLHPKYLITLPADLDDHTR
ncbi:MAG: type IV toxin-antitoxin system AbiEi family antitoxin domain-containing protein [Thiobacillus sp.]